MAIKISLERAYVALSIKHSEYRGATFWGSGGPTDDSDKRCYAGYTPWLEEAERYSLQEFRDKYGESLFLYEPVEAAYGMVARYKQYDTVFLTVEEARKLVGGRSRPESMSRNTMPSTAYQLGFHSIDKAAETIAVHNERCRTDAGEKCAGCPYAGSIFGCDDAGTVLAWLESAPGKEQRR